ncbi:unnamed protein product [Orchesella dallaii]|uniref:Uncharacterized protein n=1 Tax=Orchesella dallaii TaxID=48710 RepID=A0ABP1PTT3_9HEXA
MFHMTIFEISFLHLDVPEPPSLTEIKCPEEIDSRFCNIILTTKGLNEETAFTPSDIKSKWFEAIKSVDDHSDSPSWEVQQAAGRDYLTDVEMKLAVISKIVDKEELRKLFYGLSTGDNGILKTLAAYRAASPEDRKAFTDLSSKVGEFEAETRKLFVDVLQTTDNVEETLHQMQEEHYEFIGNILGFKEMVMAHQSLISDIM